MARKQCRKCPWRKDVDPFDIPNGYCPTKHAALASTIAPPGELRAGPMRLMACHESTVDKPIPCVGWLVNQLGDGNNLGLRLQVLTGRLDADVATVGPQHRTLAATLPRRRRTRRS